MVHHIKNWHDIKYSLIKTYKYYVKHFSVLCILNETQYYLHLHAVITSVNKRYVPAVNKHQDHVEC
jgi:hypothetical protein